MRDAYFFQHYVSTITIMYFKKGSSRRVCRHRNTVLYCDRFSRSLLPELSEDWSSVREPVIEGVPFYVKYLGSSLVQKASGEEATADAIKTIVAMVSELVVRKDTV